MGDVVTSVWERYVGRWGLEKRRHSDGIVSYTLVRDGGPVLRLAVYRR